MADMHHNQPGWEDQWQQAFEGAETPPAAHVWKNIEGELAVQESGKYRRGYKLYRAVAAVLLLLIAGLSWHILSQQPHPETVVNLENVGQEQDGPSAASVPSVPDEDSDAPVTQSAEEQRSQAVDIGVATKRPSEQTATAKKPAEPQQKTATGLADGSAAATDGEGRATLPNASRSASHADDAIPAVTSADGSSPAKGRSPGAFASSVTRVASETVTDASPLQLPTQAETALYRVPQVPANTAQKDRKPVALFAGLSMTPGYFDPQFQSTAPSDFGVVALSPGPSNSFTGIEAADRTFNTAAASETMGVENTPELSFTYGFDVGLQLSDHWVLEGGVDYNRFSTSAATRWVVADVASGQRYAFVAANMNTLSNDLSRAPNTSTELNNDYEFIAVPLKVGYRRSVSRFQFTLSSGLAANFFLGNNISASNAASEISTYRISVSKDGSPFNDVYYSGLLSGGVNYNVLGSYFLSLAPTYAFALTPLTRADSDLGSNPYSFGVNVGFQYQF